MDRDDKDLIFVTFIVLMVIGALCFMVNMRKNSIISRECIVHE